MSVHFCASPHGLRWAPTSISRRGAQAAAEAPVETKTASAGRPATTTTTTTSTTTNYYYYYY
eukprot:9628109-Heterocapsa_arctica.AAC.1